MKFVKVSYVHFLFLILIGIVVSVYYRQVKLESNFLVSSGKVAKINLGSNNGGTVQFRFNEWSKKKNASFSVGTSRCITHLNKNIAGIIKHQFPVVYLKDDLSNSEILLFKDQYKTYNIDVPEELIEIVELMSKCR